MTPTNKLRFIERDCYIKDGESFQHPFKQRILQQRWENQSVVLAILKFDNYGNRVVEYPGEWRDVPLEEEK